MTNEEQEWKIVMPSTLATPAVDGETCEEHKWPISTYCEDCAVLACDNCVFVNHRPHTTLPIAVARELHFCNAIKGFSFNEERIKLEQDEEEFKMLNSDVESTLEDIFDLKRKLELSQKDEQELRYKADERIIHYNDSKVENFIIFHSEYSEFRKKVSEKRNVKVFIDPILGSAGMKETLKSVHFAIDPSSFKLPFCSQNPVNELYPAQQHPNGYNFGSNLPVLKMIFFQNNII